MDQNKSDITSIITRIIQPLARANLPTVDRTDYSDSL